MAEKRIMHLWEAEDPGSYELAMTASGSAEDRDRLRQQLKRWLFKVTDQGDSITARFTGEWLAAANKMRQLEREGWEL